MRSRIEMLANVATVVVAITMVVLVVNPNNSSVSEFH